MIDRLMGINPDDLQKIVEHEKEIRFRLDNPKSGKSDWWGKYVVGNLDLKYWIAFPNRSLCGTLPYERDHVDDVIAEYAKEELGIDLPKKKG